VKCRSNKPPPDRSAVYDGAIHVGYVDQRRDGRFRAYDVDGRMIGTYTTQREATRAIPAPPGEKNKTPKENSAWFLWCSTAARQVRRPVILYAPGSNGAAS
jgi:hypothetical protein